MTRVRARPRASYHLTQAECDRLKILCTVHSQATAASIVGCSEMAVSKARRRGWLAGPTRAKRPRPNDFALRASEMPKDALCKHYHCDWETVTRWLVGINRQYAKKLPPQNQLQIPADFQAVLKAKGPKATARHYGRAESTIYRWRQLLGLLPRQRRTHGPGWVDRWAAERRAQSRSQNGGIHV